MYRYDTQKLPCGNKPFNHIVKSLSGKASSQIFIIFIAHCSVISNLRGNMDIR